MRYLPQTIHVHVGDTVEWVNQTSNEVHGVTFLAGQALPQIPDWYFEPPTATGASYDGSTYASSGSLYPADAGRAQSFALSRPSGDAQSFDRAQQALARGEAQAPVVRETDRAPVDAVRADGGPTEAR